ncbi:hypothetical protein ACL9RL_16670 [Plantibacter sp. Mn2098]|uniref:hypothetical protein n=1 Tax=Plantibacter sp. Mn2098 TaxID=3395266 RepID=UPI003BE85D0D
MNMTAMATAVYSAGSTEVLVEKHSEQVYSVSVEGRRCGFVERVGNVYVVLSGVRYATAEEVLQTLDFDRAVERLGSLARQ